MIPGAGLGPGSCPNGVGAFVCTPAGGVFRAGSCQGAGQRELATSYPKREISYGAEFSLVRAGHGDGSSCCGWELERVHYRAEVG